ncbi:hypothetical protein JHK82_016161 [Glycine max]|nr:hypothetical protein JHK85_016564 [Glycine max]KAG5149280.1 hypothetical protein JHK82_016161 [Glycine max]
MSYPKDANWPSYLDNSLILSELNYNNDEVRSKFLHLFSHMTASSLRADKKIVIMVASSGIASLLFPRGRTAHSKFKIPVPIFEDSTCNIHQGSQLA